MTRRQLVIARVLFAMYLVAVAVLCFGKFDSSQDVPKSLWGIPTDKVVHFLMFFRFRPWLTWPSTVTKGTVRLPSYGQASCSLPAAPMPPSLN